MEILNPFFAAMSDGDDVPHTLHLERIYWGDSHVDVQASGNGTAVIKLKWDGTYLTQLVYQLGHEVGHVLANNWPNQFQPGPHHWIEEACADSLALLAYRQVAPIWKASADADRSNAELDWCYHDRIKASPCLLHSFDESREWYRQNREIIQDLDGDMSKDYLVLRPATVFIHEWLQNDLRRINGLRGRNRWIDLREDETDHVHRWAEGCRRNGLSTELPEFVQEAFFA
jgi:hypothetical protein